jgi:hypothetical protein
MRKIGNVVWGRSGGGVGGANIQAQVCHSSALFRMWLNSMSSALTPPYMTKVLCYNFCMRETVLPYWSMQSP